MPKVFSPIPAGEYTASIKYVNARKVNERTFLDVSWEIADENVTAATNRDTPLICQSILIDFSDIGAIDTGEGKNIVLNHLREALGQNVPCVWSPVMLVGQSARVKVEHCLSKGLTYTDVKVAKL